MAHGNNSEFLNLPNFSEHFKEAMEGDSEAELIIYNEVIESENRYGTSTLIASGGMKEIYTCTDLKSSRKVAIAKLKNSSDLKSYEKFIREARITASLEHPNIIPVYDVDVDKNGEPFFTMKYVKGYNLEEYCKKEKPSFVSLMQIFSKICDAVAYSHSKNVVHLDLKPANIQIDEFGEVLVCDWGIAKVLGEDSQTTETVLDPVVYNEFTLDGLIKGSPGYLAPEQISSDKGCKDQQTDIFALGGILYFMLSGRAPFKAGELKTCLENTLSGKLKKPSEVASVNESLEAVCLKALSVKKEERYFTVSDLKSEIDNWLNGFATEAENASLFKAFRLLFNRHKTVCSILVIAVITTSFFLFKNYYTEKLALQNLRMYIDEKNEKESMARDESPRLIGLGEIALSESRFDEASNFAKLAVLRDSDNEDAWKLKCRIHFYRQEFAACLKTFNKLDDNTYKRTRAAAEYYVKFKSSDSELLSANKFIELLRSNKNKFSTKQLFDYATTSITDLDYQLKISLFYHKEIDNPKVKSWHETVKNIDGQLHCDFSGHKKMSSLYGLRNLPIQKLDLSNTAVNDINHLLEMPLIEVDICGTKILDPRPLFKMKTTVGILVTKDQYKETNFKPASKLIRKTVTQ